MLGGILLKHEHQSNFGYFRKDLFKTTLNKVQTREVMERQASGVTHRSQSDFRLFSEGCTHCNVLFFGQPKKQRKDLNIKHFATNITR